VPLSAAAQSVPPVPQVPPAPPMPMVAPAPVMPMVPPVHVRVAPMVDTFAIEDAVRASRDAIAQIDMDAIRQQARDAAQQARDAAQQSRDMARELAEQDIQMRSFSLPSFNYNFNYNVQN